MVEKKPTVEVSVYDSSRHIISNAKVTLKPLEKETTEIKDLHFDQSSKLYKTNEINFEKYILKVEANNFKPDEREVTVDPSRGLKDIFILGKEDQHFYFRGTVKVPFEPRNDLLAVSIRRNLTANAADEGLLETTSKFNLESVPINKSILEKNIRVFKIKPKSAEDSARERITVQEELSKNPSIKHAGPIIQMNDESISFLTNEIIAKFKADVKEDEISAILNQYNLDTVRAIPYAKNTFHLKARTQASYDILRICEEIVQSGKVEYAEPNLFSTPVMDSTSPTDFLFSQQWHLSIINAPTAWSILNDISPDITFGSPNIIVAVMDSGIDSQHPDLNGRVANGSSKIYQLYDFANMVANNDDTDGHHGTCCAGVAAANINNPSVVSGENEGVAGAAGNCRLIGLRQPGWEDGIEDRYADAYMWSAGFDPKSPLGGFPAQINPGADIITSSFGYSVGEPISGLMKDTFDFLTTHGREGKGVLLFFSAGNANMDFTFERPWAAYEKTFAVAASSLANDGITEVRATYSNYGGSGIIDICAPSNDGIPVVHNPPMNYAISTTTITGTGNLSGHTDGNRDYTNSFGGTSSATPLTAGVAALILSANPDLTWIEVREILRSTAVKIDANNQDPIGKWTDINGNTLSDPGYEGPNYSRWYGYGRIDAAAAVKKALEKANARR